MKRLAVLISNTGTGTNLQAIINAIEQKKINARIVVVVSDTEKTLGLERAKKHHLPIAICKRKEDLLSLLRNYNSYYSSKSANWRRNREVKKANSSRQARTISPVDYICLAGWKQIITDDIIDLFPNRILNIHPGLIPDYLDETILAPDKSRALWNKGKLTNAAIKNFLDTNSTYAGSSLNFLSHEFDFGKVLGRVFEKVAEDDTIDSLYTRLKVKENKLYVEVLEKICNT